MELLLRKGSYPLKEECFMSNPAINIYKQRRTQYAIGKNISIGQTDATSLIKEAVKLAPTAFNSQSSRAVI